MLERYARLNRYPERPRLGWRIAQVLATVVLALTAFDARACDLSLVETPGTVTIDYNPFGVSPSAAALNIKINNRADEACDLRLAFTDDGGLDLTTLVLGEVGLGFRPRESSGLTAMDIEPGTYRFNIPARTTRTAQFDIPVVSNAVPEAGEHAADIRVRVMDPDGVELLPDIPVRVLLVSTPRAQLNIAGATGAFGSGSSVEVVEFDEAVTGATRRLFVQVRANALSILKVSSEHRGTMTRLAEDKIETDSVVPYQVDIDGTLVDLADVWSREVDPPRTLAGVSLPMTFTLGAVSGQMAGRYQDLITIDVSPK